MAPTRDVIVGSAMAAQSLRCGFWATVKGDGRLRAGATGLERMPPARRAKNFWRNVGLADARSSFEQGGQCGLENRGDKTMRVMVMVKATKDCEAGVMP